MSSSKKNLEQALGDIIRSRREELGLSQEQFAFECGLHRTYISQLERGHKSPTLRVLFLIAAALEMPPDEIVRLAHSTLKK